jgi:hypothetical protein
MADGKTLNARNLERLGAARLAELLIEIADTTAAKRRLRVELAGSFGPAEVARDVRRRLAAIRQAGGMLSRKRMAGVVAELEQHWSAIATLVTPQDPRLALDLGWEILALSAPLDRRANDGADALADLYARLLPDLPVLLAGSAITSDHLADHVAGLIAQEVGLLNEDLIAVTADALGKRGLHQMQSRLAAARCDIVDGADWVIRHRQRHYDLALRAIADHLADPDSFAATLSEADLLRPDLALALATRLAVAGRGAAALVVIDRLEGSRPRYLDPVFPLLKARILAEGGDLAGAQTLRWRVFAQTLSADALRAFIRPLPDFDDMQAEEKAFALAALHSDVHVALRFFLDWPALSEAETLVVRRFREVDGDLYDLLTPAAEVLAERHPLAATLLLRAMIDHSLTWARHSRYRHAARHLATCADLVVPDWGAVPDHLAYVTGLRRAHAKKPGFWAAVADT